MRLDFLHAIGTEARLSREAFLKATQEEQFRDTRDRAEKRKEREEQADADATDLIYSVIMASEANLTSFTIKLDTYDRAVIEALLKNEEDLKLAKERVEDLHARAYVLDDGRRVFKTEDGTKVFDEHGKEVGRDEIDPEMIDDTRPSYEKWRDANNEFNALSEERAQLLDYQNKLDEARERLGQGDLSQRELEELQTQLDDKMPAAVRAQLPGQEATTAMTQSFDGHGLRGDESDLDLQVDGPMGPS